MTGGGKVMSSSGDCAYLSAIQKKKKKGKKKEMRGSY
jgi:hypothetical protein